MFDVVRLWKEDYLGVTRPQHYYDSVVLPLLYHSVLQ